jgi:hypothetical protein
VDRLAKLAAPSLKFLCALPDRKNKKKVKETISQKKNIILLFSVAKSLFILRVHVHM